MKRTALFLALLTLALTLLPGCTPPEEDPAALAAKPVIYLYPEAETEVTVSLDYGGELTCVYPAFDGGASWSVTAAPDGTLTDAAGQTYNYLYWEGVSDADYDFSEGFCVPGGDTAAFLEDALADLGLTRREANEFIVYWLPRMEANAYNLISFQTIRLHGPRPAHRGPGAGHGAAGVHGLAVPLRAGGHSAPGPHRAGAHRLHPGGVGRRGALMIQLTQRRNPLVSSDCHRAGLRRTV